VSTQTTGGKNSATSELLQSVPSIPRDDEGPVFNEPQLTNSIQTAQNSGDPDLGDTYYLHWLDALEKMVVSKGIGAAAQLTELYSQWEAAASSTPHGQTIELPQKLT